MWVPQGTVLCPVLFNVYVNHLCDLSVGGRVIAYADDTVVIFHDRTWGTVCERLKLGFKKIKNLLDNLQLSLNIKKKQIILLSP